MAKEEVKRLEPVKETLRELFLKSGNCCAFPGCTEIMINADGVFIGQLCHIEAAETKGQRFNPAQTNEDRRQFSNLMLMCYTHHCITNDVNKFTTPVLKQMKADHEAKFTDVAQAIEEGISDESVKIQGKKASTLIKIDSVLGHAHDTEILPHILKDIEAVVAQLKMLPIRTRQLLAIIVSRLARRSLPKDRYSYETNVSVHEISEACNLDRRAVIAHVETMTKYRVAEISDTDTGPLIRLWETPEGWFIWGDLQEFSVRSGIPIGALIVDLRFDLLD